MAISCHLGWPLFLQMPLYCCSCLTEKNLLSCPRTSFLSILLQEARLGGLLDKALTVRPDEGHAPDYGHEGKLLQKDGYWPPLSSLVIHGMFCLFDRSVSLQRGTPSSPLTRPTPPAQGSMVLYRVCCLHLLSLRQGLDHPCKVVSLIIYNAKW